MSATADPLQNDIDKEDLKKFRNDAQDAYFNGTLDSAVRELQADVVYEHEDGTQTGTGQGPDQYIASLNNTDGDVTFCWSFRSQTRSVQN